MYLGHSVLSFRVSGFGVWHGMVWCGDGDGDGRVWNRYGVWVSV